MPRSITPSLLAVGTLAAGVRGRPRPAAQDQPDRVGHPGCLGRAARRRLGSLVLTVGLSAGASLPQVAVAAPAAQATFVVTSTADAVDAHPGDGQCRTAAGTCTLRAAIQEANAHVGADVITLPAGSYVLTLPNADPEVGEDLGLTGDLDIRDSLTIRGAGAATTIIDGNHLDRLLEVLGPVQVSVANLTLRAGLSPNGRGQGGSGGGVFNNGGVLTLDRVVFSDVTDSGFDGAAIHNTGTLTVRHSTVAGQKLDPTMDEYAIVNDGVLAVENSSVDGAGAIRNDGTRRLTITNSTITGASLTSATIANAGTLVMTGGTLKGDTEDGFGGGLANGGTATLRDLIVSGLGFHGGGGILNGGTLELDGVTISNSRELGNGGAGIWHQGGKLTVRRSRITDNHAVSGGGGILSQAGQVTLTDTVLSGNTADEGGAGIFADGSSVLTLTNSTIANNTGGGILFNGQQLTLTNVTLSGNTANGSGGAGLLVLGRGPVSVTNSTIVNNTAPSVGTSGGIGGPASLRNTLLAHNTGVAADGKPIAEANCGQAFLPFGESLGVPVSLGHNLGSGTSCHLTGPGDLSTTDPKLGPLANNGGPTQTHALRPGSPAIDAGTNTGCPKTDQRGVARPQDSNGDGTTLCDIGAYEVKAPLPKLAFVSKRDGNDEIYTMLADGSQPRRLTTNPADDHDPAWSPDRKRIAFVSNRDGNDELYVMHADGSGQTRLTTTPALDQSPAWSPDGTKLAFASNRDGNFEIYVMPSSGGPARRLTFAKGDDKSPAWSPDGTRIAFTSRRDGNPEIYVMQADGSHQTRLTTNPADDKKAAWSPDGTQLAFSSNRDGNDEIYVMHADGTSPTRLTANAASDVQASWSADGKLLAFTSSRDGNQELYVMHADGTQQTRITTNPAADFWPAFQPRLRTLASAADAADSVSTDDAVLAP